METIIIHPKSQNKLQEIKGILKALKVDFEIKRLEELMDETAYLSSSSANKKHLNDSIKNIKKGNVTKVKLEELWK
jgi:ATP-dependent RNA circularization protein (DNA/RNA ligase family)